MPRLIEEFYTLESKRRTTGTSSSFKYSMQNPYVSFLETYEIELLSAQIPWLIYNVRAGVNDTMVWRRGVTDYSCTVPAGAYTQTTLRTALGTAMQAADANSWSVFFNVDQNTVYIQGTGAFTVNFATTTIAAGISAPIAPILGFSTTANSSSGTTVTAPNVMDLSKPDMLYINIKEIGQKQMSSNYLDKYTFSIPVTVNTPNVLLYNKGTGYEQKYTYNSPQNISELTVELFYAGREAVNLNGVEWSMQFKIKYTDP
jgi:hypothetical protein